MKNMIYLASTALIMMNVANAANISRSLASIKHSIRVDHARELLGKGYKNVFTERKGLEHNILQTVEKRLPKAYKKDAVAIAEAIINESEKHTLDPYFVVALISGESSFNPMAVGPVGEIGLMQIRPATGEWIAHKTHQAWSGDRSLRDPVANIKLGTAYIAWLRAKFKNNGQLYVAAYNMGAKSVSNAVGKNVYPKDYPRHVMKRYLALYREVATAKL